MTDDIELKYSAMTYADGSLRSERWYYELTDDEDVPLFANRVDGKAIVYHREDGPAIINYRRTHRMGISRIDCEHWARHGRYHREGDLPAFVAYSNDGDIKIQRYYKNGTDIQHREGGPAEIRHQHYSQIRTRLYFMNDDFYREDGPQEVIEYFDGTPVLQKFYRDSYNLHRIDGPAVMRFDRDFVMYYWEYWVDGKQIPNEALVGVEPGSEEFLFIASMI